MVSDKQPTQTDRLGLDRVGTADDGQGIYKLSREDVRIYLEGLKSIKEAQENDD